MLRRDKSQLKPRRSCGVKRQKVSNKPFVCPMDVTLSFAALAAILGLRFVYSNKMHPYPSSYYDPVQSIAVAKKTEPPRPPYTQNILNTFIPSPDVNANRIVDVNIIKNDADYQNKWRRIVNMTENNSPISNLLDPADVFKRQTPKGSNLINML